MSQEGDKQHDRYSNLLSTAPLVALFFTAMILHEIALESITAVYSLPPYNISHLASSVTLFQFGFCVLLPFALSLFSSEGDVVRNLPRTRRDFLVYSQLSIVVYGATALATMSLGYEGVTYITKVVFKSAKLIPTMVVGAILDARAARKGRITKNRKNYSLWDYSSALLLSVGAAGFCISPESKENENEENTEIETKYATDGSSQGGASEHFIGVFLLTASVFCDALVPNIQEKLMHGISPNASPPQHQNNDVGIKAFIRDDAGNQAVERSTCSESKQVEQGLSSLSLMVNTNAIGFTLLLLSTILSCSLVSIIRNIMTHPRYFLLLLTVGLGLGTAVLAYTELIRRSGPAIAVAVATLRKVVTVVLSYIIFPKIISWIHLLSTSLVLLGLLVGFIGRGKKR
ncbi:hypothetical protein HJC23_009473 [Cyclotella cryptica]|uniref:Uncharacterized protein n=1 Tax=Cyclotella cryptica TaxID=29204 RepID=A0ABD3NEM9_9STRA|eukprot:CCRYP_021150-RA/>CCRYP_021150-RA protein AED:0.08 eAED:0.08 QI:0/-1/0/1/-1/1/1/0/401